jgi:hypothetical protein
VGRGGNMTLKCLRPLPSWTALYPSGVAMLVVGPVRIWVFREGGETRDAHHAWIYADRVEIDGPDYSAIQRVRDEA